MSLLIKINLLMLIFFFTSFPQECYNTLRIASDCTEVNIFVNDSLISTNGNVEIELKDGEYILVAEEVNDRWNAKSFTDTIKLSVCETKIINYYFKSELLIESIPNDAYVFVNDSLLGFTPLKVPVNQGELKITKPGYREKRIQFGDGSFHIVKLDFDGTLKSDPFVQTPLFKILTGSAIILGAVTAYFKLKADDKFDEYRFSGNKKFLDETNRLDTISGVSLALFQINFGYIIYRFLAE